MPIGGHAVDHIIGATGTAEETMEHSTVHKKDVAHTEDGDIAF